MSKCKTIKRLCPAAVAWGLLIGATSLFFVFPYVSFARTPRPPITTTDCWSYLAPPYIDANEYTRNSIIPSRSFKPWSPFLYYRTYSSPLFWIPELSNVVCSAYACQMYQLLIVYIIYLYFFQCQPIPMKIVVRMRYIKRYSFKAQWYAWNGARLASSTDHQDVHIAPCVITVSM